MSDTDNLSLAVGETVCHDSFWVKLWYYFGFATIATIFFVILAYRPLDGYLEYYAKGPNNLLLLKASSFFIIVFLIGLYFIQYYKKTDICGSETIS